MARKKQSITGLDINGRYIACAQSVPKENLVTNVSIQPLTTGVPDYWKSVEESFKDLADEVGLKGCLSVSSLPGEFAVIKTITLDEDEENVEEALQWEFSQHIIGSADEYSFDYQKLQDFASQKRYLLAGYKKNAIKRLVSLLKENKLSPLVVDIDIFALINVFEINYAEQINEAALIIYGDEEKTRLILTQEGMFLDFDMIHYQDGLETADQYCQNLSNAVDRIRGNNLAQGGESILPIYLTGALFTFDDYVQAVQSCFSHVEILFPFRKIQCCAGMDDESLKKYSPQLAVAVGLAMRGND